MKHELFLAIYYKNELNYSEVKKMVHVFDPHEKVDLQSDDHVTHLPETYNGKALVVNMKFGSKNFKEAVFDLMVKASKMGSGWTTDGPIKLRKYTFNMHLNSPNLYLVNGIALTLHKN